MEKRDFGNAAVVAAAGDGIEYVQTIPSSFRLAVPEFAKESVSLKRNDV